MLINQSVKLATEIKSSFLISYPIFQLKEIGISSSFLNLMVR